ncbi:MAG: hypothetical protein JNM07_13550 [Phycisphaerae bacterium]|nr:hypothetical protein [Phycisphaerae bacterium]
MNNRVKRERTEHRKGHGRQREFRMNTLLGLREQMVRKIMVFTDWTILARRQPFLSRLVEQVPLST